MGFNSDIGWDAAVVLVFRHDGGDTTNWRRGGGNSKGYTKHLMSGRQTVLDKDLGMNAFLSIPKKLCKSELGSYISCRLDSDIHLSRYCQGDFRFVGLLLSTLSHVLDLDILMRQQQSLLSANPKHVGDIGTIPLFK